MGPVPTGNECIVPVGGLWMAYKHHTEPDGRTTIDWSGRQRRTAVEMKCQCGKLFWTTRKSGRKSCGRLWTCAKEPQSSCPKRRRPAHLQSQTILLRLSKGESLITIAVDYGVSYQAIQGIRNRANGKTKTSY